ncbi:MAG: peptide chain release factor N(5)-glutamine methyltransferase [Planctomycetes bacterium]|nr:peptide chain release factor N(5)-glutamine methyltransferase [Planctomycetota bacterium]
MLVARGGVAPDLCPTRTDVTRTLAHVLGTDRLRLLMDSDRPLLDAERTEFRARFERLLTGEPLAYVLGTCEFYGRQFSIDNRALIPRPETELLVTEALRRLPQNATVFEPCTGSGCIAISLVLERADLVVSASDVSKDALALARHNAKSLGARVGFAEGSWWEPAAGRTFDALVANPPYVRPDAPELLDASVARFEPGLALFSEPGRPLSSYEALLRGGVAGLRSGGHVLFEAGIDTTQDLARILERSASYDQVDVLEDEAGIPRIVAARRK